VSEANGQDIRTFRGRSLEEVLPQIREELGPDAIITRQREGLQGGIAGFFQKQFVEVEARAGTPRVQTTGERRRAPVLDVYDEDDSVAPPPSVPMDGDDEATSEGLSSPAIQAMLEQAAPFADYLSAADRAQRDAPPEREVDPDVEAALESLARARGVEDPAGDASELEAVEQATAEPRPVEEPVDQAAASTDLEPTRRPAAAARRARQERPAAAGKIEETKIEKFNSTTFTPIATAKVKVPGPGFLTATGNLSAKEVASTTSAQDTKLQYRLSVGSKPLSTIAESFELFLPDLALPTDEQRENGAVTGVLKQTTPGIQEVKLEAQVVGANASATILGRSVSVVFVPKGKLPKTKKGKKPTGKKPPSDTPVGP